MQLWLINAHGGEAWHLTDLAHSPKQAEWLDKDTIVFSAPEDPALYEMEMKKKKDDSDVIDDADHEPPVRLYKVNVKDGKITRLTTNTDWIERFDISHDGKYVVASHAKSLHYAFDQKAHPIVVIHSLSGGEDKQVFTDLRIRPEGFEWSFDNSGFYMATPFSTDARFMTAGITIVYFFDVMTGKSTQVNLDTENGLGFDLQTIPGGFLALLAAGSHDDFARYAAEKGAAGWTWKRQIISGEPRYEYIEAIDGDVGLKAAREQKPDVIILDLQMPTMNGFTVLQELHADSRTSVTPVIVSTSLNVNAELKARLPAGTRVISKNTISRENVSLFLRDATLGAS